MRTTQPAVIGTVIILALAVPAMAHAQSTAASPSSTQSAIAHAIGRTVWVNAKDGTKQHGTLTSATASELLLTRYGKTAHVAFADVKTIETRSSGARGMIVGLAAGAAGGAGLGLTLRSVSESGGGLGTSAAMSAGFGLAGAVVGKLLNTHREVIYSAR